MQPVIAVDFGGTHIRGALFPDDHPHPSNQTKVKTNALEGPDEVVDRIVGVIGELIPSMSEGLRIGIAPPGILDKQKQVVLNASNLPGWENYPIKTKIENRICYPVFIENDSKLAALGEYRFGAGVESDPLLYLTIGTGIGGALIINGEILQGSHGLASEMGHMTVDPSGPMCSCGKRGHLEAIASGPAVTRMVIERLRAGEGSVLQALLSKMQELDMEAISRAAIEGDQLAMDAISNAGKVIGKHLASLMHALDPARIVIGGGMAQIGDLLFKPIRGAIKAETISSEFLQDVEVLPAHFGDDSGLIGAMILAREA